MSSDSALSTFPRLNLDARNRAVYIGEAFNSHLVKVDRSSFLNKRLLFSDNNCVVTGAINSKLVNGVGACICLIFID